MVPSIPDADYVPGLWGVREAPFPAPRWPHFAGNRHSRPSGSISLQFPRPSSRVAMKSSRATNPRPRYRPDRPFARRCGLSAPPAMKRRPGHRRVGFVGPASPRPAGPSCCGREQAVRVFGHCGVSVPGPDYDSHPWIRLTRPHGDRYRASRLKNCSLAHHLGVPCQRRRDLCPLRPSLGIQLLFADCGGPCARVGFSDAWVNWPRRSHPAPRPSSARVSPC